MPTKTKSKSARVAGGKAIIKKTKKDAVLMNHHRKDMRFKVSLVILMGMLTFSLMLFLFSLNKSVARSSGAEVSEVTPVKKDSEIKKAEGRVLNDASLDFKVTMPAQIDTWLYKIGEVKSLTDESLSNQYLRMFVPIAGAKSNNFDQQNKDILTIRKFTGDEWADITKSCQKGKEDICDAAGELITKDPDSSGEDWVYSFTKPTDCPKSIEAECSLADKIVQSFQLK